MAGALPEELTTDGEQKLWWALNKLFDAHTGDDPAQFAEREQEFVNVLEATLRIMEKSDGD